MKIHEVVQLTEGPMDWLARKGFLGKEKQIGAIGTQLDKRDAAMQTAAAKSAAEKFKRGLSGALSAGEAGGQIGASGMPVKDFVEQYVNSLIRNYKIPPKFPGFGTLYNDFEKNYSGGGKLPPEADKIWNSVVMLSSMQRQSSASSYEPPKSKVDGFSPKGSKFTYDFDPNGDGGKGLWTQFEKSSGKQRHITSAEDDFDVLNRMYKTERRL